MEFVLISLNLQSELTYLMVNIRKRANQRILVSFQQSQQSNQAISLIPDFDRLFSDKSLSNNNNGSNFVFTIM